MSAYFIFNHKVSNTEKLHKEYLPKAVASLKPYDIEILVVDPNHELVEGDLPNDRTVILKFRSKEEAKKWYYSDEYQSIIHLRLEAVNGFAALCDAYDPSSV